VKLLVAGQEWQTVAFLALNKGGYFGANINVGQTLKMHIRTSFTVVNLHGLWSNYRRGIWHVIGLAYAKEGKP